MVHVFDAYGTLLDVHAPLRLLEERVGPKAAAVSATWRTKQLEYTWVRTLGGLPWKDFAALTAEALGFALALHGVEGGAALRAEALALYGRLALFPDARDVLQALHGRGEMLAVLSNGTEAMLQASFATAGVADLFAEIVSVDPLRRYKTAAEVYRHGCDRLQVAPEDVRFYSSNRWDVAAGTAFGFSTIWVNRTGAPDEYPDQPPSVVVQSLAEAVA